MNVGIVNTGIVCPGTNNVISEITKFERRSGNRVHGYTDGWVGLNHNYRDELRYEDLSYEPGSILYTSKDDTLDLEMAKPVLWDLDKLYAIVDHDNCGGALKIIQDFRFHRTNVVCVGKSLTHDVSFGFQTVVHGISDYVHSAKIHAKTSKCVVYVEVSGSEMARRVASACAHIVDAVITPETDESHQFDVENAFAINSHAVVVCDVACSRERLFIMGDMKLKYGVDSEILRPGVTSRYLSPCPYDNILSGKIARDAVDFSRHKRNFMTTGVDSFVTLV
jgi:6-phosphofructokinase